MSDLTTTYDVVWEPVGSPSLATLDGMREDRVTVGPTTTSLDIPAILATRYHMDALNVRVLRACARWTR